LRKSVFEFLFKRRKKLSKKGGWETPPPHAWSHPFVTFGHSLAKCPVTLEPGAALTILIHRWTTCRTLSRNDGFTAELPLFCRSHDKRGFHPTQRTQRKGHEQKLITINTIFKKTPNNLLLIINDGVSKGRSLASSVVASVPSVAFIALCQSRPLCTLRWM